MRGRLEDLMRNCFHVSMPCSVSRSVFLIQRDVDNMTLCGSNVQERPADRQNVVDLARVNDAGKLFAHHDDVQVSRRKQTRKLGERLIGQAKNVLQIVADGKRGNFVLLTAAADEAENNLRLIRKPTCGLEQRIKWVARAVITGVHHHKPLGQTVPLAKCLAALLVPADILVKRPWRQDDNLSVHDSFVDDPLPHEAIQDDDSLRLPQAVTQERLQRSGYD